MTDTKVYIEHEYDSCVHVTVEGASNQRSAVQLARNYASNHYGMPVGHYVSSGGRYGPNHLEIATYVYSAPDMVQYRDIVELVTVRHGRITGVTVFPVREMDKAHERARTINDQGVYAYVKQVTEYRRASKIPAGSVSLVKGPLVCGECGEPARKRAVVAAPVGWELAVTDRSRLAYEHTDGEPLCPEVTADGYQSCRPVRA